MQSLIQTLPENHKSTVQVISTEEKCKVIVVLLPSIYFKLLQQGFPKCYTFNKPC